MTRKLLQAIACALVVAASGQRAFIAQEATPQYKPNLPGDDPAIRYARAEVDDAASRLARGIADGSVTLDVHDARVGVLPALLDRLHVSVDSQMLVFSKTSFQAPRISPSHPRAIYFNDEVMVGFVPGAPTLEIAALDPALGPVFYTMTTDGSRTPVIARSSACIRCHEGPNTAGVPGIYVGSVLPGPTGAPLRDDTAIVTDQRSPFAERWGGWYVTARAGEGRDRANAVASNPADPASLVREARQNLTRLDGFFDATPYPARFSDIVALMTFEHQTQMTNLITRVGWEARILTHERTDDRALPSGAEASMARRRQPSEDVARTLRPSDPNVTQAMLDVDIEDLVEYMLFSGEAPLKEPIEGVSTFARTFAARGPRDHRGRSLRDFDLKTRLFRYPLSYMIYSASFDALPAPARDRIYRKLYAVLSGDDRSPAFAHLSRADRQAVLEILAETKRGLPDFFFGDRIRRP